MKKSEKETYPEKALPGTTGNVNKVTENIVPAPANWEISSASITEEYKAFLLEKGRRPSSVFHFARHLQISEREFYDYYSSLETLEKMIWEGYFEETLTRIKADETYLAYSVREKLLAFYFTWIEVLKKDRSYVIYAIKKSTLPQWAPNYIQGFKKEYLAYVRTLINEGKEKEEIAPRYWISNRYGDGLWLQLMFVLNFWARDSSKDFEDTDAAIEKAVNLSFDLMGKSPFDAVLDMAKFLYNKW